MKISILLAGVVIGAASASVGLIAFAQDRKPEPLKVSSLEIVDASGKTRIRLCVPEPKVAGRPNEPAIILLDAAGRDRAILWIDDDKEPILRLRDDADRIAEIGVDEKDGPRIRLTDDEKVLFKAP